MSTQILEAPKQFILDVSKWKCGYNVPKEIPEHHKHNTLGLGTSSLRNKEGYMCCLGQYIAQIAPDLVIDGKGKPNELPIEIPLLSYKIFSEEGDESIHDTALTEAAISINDGDLHIEEKIENLRTLFAKEGVELIVINNEKESK